MTADYQGLTKDSCISGTAVYQVLGKEESGTSFCLIKVDRFGGFFVDPVNPRAALQTPSQLVRPSGQTFSKEGHLD